jgi:hypothetical protein
LFRRDQKACVSHEGEHQRSQVPLGGMAGRLLDQRAVLVRPLRGMADITFGCWISASSLARDPSVGVVALNIRGADQSRGGMVRYRTDHF